MSSGLSSVEVGSIVTSIAALVGSVATFVKLYLDQRKTKKEVELTVKYLRELSRFVESNIKAHESQQQIKREEFEWQKVKDIGKGLWEYFKYEMEEE